MDGAPPFARTRRPPAHVVVVRSLRNGGNGELMLKDLPARPPRLPLDQDIAVPSGLYPTGLELPSSPRKREAGVPPLVPHSHVNAAVQDLFGPVKMLAAGPEGKWRKVATEAKRSPLQEV